MSQVAVGLLNAAVVVLDSEGKVVFWNPAAEVMYGHKAGETVGRPASGFIPGAADADGIMAHVADAAGKDDGAAGTFERKFRRRDGHEMTVISTVLPLMRGGKPLFALVDVGLEGNKRVERSPSGDERRYRAFVEKTKDVVFSLDMEGRFTYVSPQIGRYGNRPEQLIGRSFLEFVHPEERDRLAAEFVGSVSTPGGLPDSTFRGLNSRGEVYWFEDASAIQYDPQGNPTGIIGILRDVTERHAAEAALAESEGRYRAFVEKTKDVVFAVDLAGKITYISPQIGRFGYAEHELVGSDFVNFVHPDDRDRMLGSYVGTLARTEKPVDFVFRAVNGKGEIFWFEETDSIQYDTVGNPTGAVGILRDVTERHAAEAALAESEGRYRAFIENTHDVVFAADRLGNVTYVSPQVKRFGVLPDDVITRGFIDFIHPADRERVVGDFMEVMAGNKPSSLQSFRIVSPNGREYWIEEADSVQADERGNPTGIIGTLRDVTVKKAVEEEVRRRSDIELLVGRHSSAFVNAAPDTLDRLITEALGDAAKLFGADRASLFLLDEERLSAKRAHVWSRFPMVQDQASSGALVDFPWAVSVVEGKEPAICRGLAGLPPRAAVEMRRLGVGDASSLAIVPLWADQKGIGAFVVLGEDGTVVWGEKDVDDMKLVAHMFASAVSRQKAEASLRQAADIIGQSPSVAFAWGDTETWPITYVSRNVLRLTGYSSEELLSGRIPFIKMVHPEDLIRFRREINEALASPGKDEIRRDPYRLVAKDGTVRWVSDWISVGRDGAGRPSGFRGVVTDITERRSAEMKVSETNRLRQRFIGIVAHQLRTPLNSIRWSLEALLAGELGELRREQRDFVRVVYDSELELIRRIHDMVTALDIEEGQISMDVGRSEPSGIIGASVSDILPEAAKRGIKVTYEPPPEGLVINVDAEKLRYAVRALLDNAVTYGHDGGVVAVKARLVGERFHLEVKDDGVGIPAAEQGRIFERFFRASNASVSHQNSSGLTLSIAKYYMERHGGRMGFESEEGRGSTFWIELPAK